MPDVRGRARIGWELIRVLQENLAALEAAASRILAAQVAGTITLWTQLYTFEDGPPEVMAWISLFVFLASLAFLGAFLRPRRLIRFWDKAIPDELFTATRPVAPQEEAWLIQHISNAMRVQRDQLERGIRVSVPLGLLALGILTLAYVIEKAWFAP